MNLFELTHARIFAGGGVQKPQQFSKKEDKCSPSFNEGWCQAR